MNDLIKRLRFVILELLNTYELNLDDMESETYEAIGRAYKALELPTIIQEENKNIICKGTYVLGTACGSCKRCVEELLSWLDTLTSAVDILKPTEHVIAILEKYRERNSL